MPKTIYVEYLKRDTIEKIFYIFEVDPTEHDLFCGTINICKRDWNFMFAPDQSSYRI